MSLTIKQILQTASPILPVIVIDDVARAVDLAHALAAADIRVLEITLRTPRALAAISAIRHALPHLWVGAGTVLQENQWRAACEAGAQFVVSPGLTDRLTATAQRLETPFLPGVFTPSEVMAAVERGFDTLKRFPAHGETGLQWLNSVRELFPSVSFCPTGGVAEGNYRAYLQLPNVVCVGGSWLTPAELVHAGAWETITQRAKEAIYSASSAR